MAIALARAVAAHARRASARLKAMFAELGQGAGRVARENELLVEWQRGGLGAAARGAAEAPARWPPATPLERARELCLALPETTERPSHGQPTFFIAARRRS